MFVIKANDDFFSNGNCSKTEVTVPNNGSRAGRQAYIMLVGHLTTFIKYIFKSNVSCRTDDSISGRLGGSQIRYAFIQIGLNETIYE